MMGQSPKFRRANAEYRKAENSNQLAWRNFLISIPVIIAAAGGLGYGVYQLTESELQSYLAGGAMGGVGLVLSLLVWSQAREQLISEMDGAQSVGESLERRGRD